MLDSLITSKTRLRLLVKFFINADNHSHLRGLAEEFGESTNAIRKELNNLSEAGYLQKESEKNRISYSANTQHPLFGSLQDIVRKYLGLDTLVEEVLDRMGDVHKVVLMGDYANGLDTGTIDIVIQGNELNEEYLDSLGNRIADLINRKVSFTVLAEDIQTGIVLYNKAAE
ncbi:ArsR family transcriptional regulator [Echinicola marina]|uniref:ArsR family transcriptional regulator n=1 Tax=Echinicola marina TaxID=2859768 RepID=UPI001CF6F1F2|nr:ArsR family transcriptional regulator [Echinicola marina]UCS93256.1 ArsR family transcriptional regulator [Echinicola marina]